MHAGMQAGCSCSCSASSSFRSPNHADLASPSRTDMLSADAIAFLKRLLDAPGPSGFETLAGRSWRAEAEGFADRVTIDVAGNCMAEINSRGSPTILIDGHIDEIGVIVQYIDDDGYI